MITDTRARNIAGLYAPATVVLFAGLGGVCIGVEQGYVEGGYTDKYVDLAVNHWATAVDVHSANHPMTQHLRCDVWEVDPNAVLPGRKIAYLHLSPDCTDFSKAKGSAPRRKHIRALADVGLAWAGRRRPDVITLENVEEFRQWGPLLDNGQPDPAKRGTEYRRWRAELEALGYVVEDRELRACDYGTPTTRKRLFVIARCDGKPIVWPEKTHGVHAALPRHKKLRASNADSEDLSSPGNLGLLRKRGLDVVSAVGIQDTAGGTSGRVAVAKGNGSPHQKLAPYLAAASCIDWSIPMLSIFATPAEAKAFGKLHGVGTPRRPLKPKTLARIAGGLDKFVIKAAKPFIVRIAHGDHCDGTSRWGNTAHDIGQPLGTVAASKDFAVVDATLAPFSVPRYGEREGQPPRCNSLDEPAATITGTGNGTTLVAAHLSTLNHGGDEHRGADLNEPLHTVTGANDARALVAALVTKHYTGVTGSSMSEPVDTVTSTDHNAVTCAYLSHFYTSNSRGGEGDPRRPAKTITSGGQHAAVTVVLMKEQNETLTNRSGNVEAGNIDHRTDVAADPAPIHRGDDRGTVPGDGIARVDALAARGLQRDQGGVGRVLGRGEEEAARSRGNADGADGVGGDGVPSGDRPSPVIPYLIGAGGSGYAAKPKSAGEPANTVMVNDRRAIVAAFLATYYGNGGTSSPAEPMPTVVSKDRIQLVTVTIDGTTYVVTDIAMRMLTPRELARAQGFPADYVIDRTADGRPVSKADQVKLIGNSVCPQLARAIARANVVDQGVLEDAAGSRGAA